MGSKKIAMSTVCVELSYPERYKTQLPYVYDDEYTNLRCVGGKEQVEDWKKEVRKPLHILIL